MPKKLSSSYIAALTIVLSATSAQAQYYGGVSLGVTRDASGHLSAGRVSSIGSIGNFANFGADSDSVTPTELLTIMPAAGLQLANEPSLGIKLGYRFNPYFAVESRYVTTNLSTLSTITPSLFSRDATNAANPIRREQSVGLDLVGNVSLMKKLSLQGRAGLRSESQALAFINTNVGNLAPAAGVMGLSLNYNFNSSIGLRFEVERSRKFFNDRFAGDVDSAVSFGVLWRF